MPMDGVMLGFVARQLNRELQDGRVDRVLQPEHDEVHLLIRAHGENLRLLLSASANAARAHLTRLAKTGPEQPPLFCMLLRKHILGARFLQAQQLGGDRILALSFQALNELGDPVVKRLIVEMMGRHSNIILIQEDGRILDAIRHVNESISRVRQILPGLNYQIPAIHQKLPPDASVAAIEAQLNREEGDLAHSIQNAMAGFSPQAALEAAIWLGYAPETPMQTLSSAAIAKELSAYLHQLPEQAPPCVIYDEQHAPKDVFPFPQRHLSGSLFETFPTPSEALEAFFSERDRAEHLRRRSASLTHLVQNQISRCEKKLAIQEEALLGAKQMDNYRLWGELLQSNLYRLQKGQRTAELEDYTQEGMPLVSVPLDSALSPAQNAQRYFKLYRKARNAQLLAAKQKADIEQELAFLLQMEDDLRKATTDKDFSELRALLEEAGYAKAAPVRGKKRKQAPSLPMKFISSDGTEIEVGKNAAQNEALTLSAGKDEYWLHAQKMPGSHVIVHSGTPSEETLLEAAKLAAFYSRGVHSAQVPIDCTQRRYVKKPAGTPTGFLIYTHQRTFYITPDEQDIRRLRLVRI